MERFGWDAAYTFDGATAAFVIISMRQAGMLREASGPGLAFLELSDKLSAIGFKPGDTVDFSKL